MGKKTATSVRLASASNMHAGTPDMLNLDELSLTLKSQGTSTKFDSFVLTVLTSTSSRIDLIQLLMVWYMDERIVKMHWEYDANTEHIYSSLIMI